jgi:hypothetical protein
MANKSYLEKSDAALPYILKFFFVLTLVIIITSIAPQFYSVYKMETFENPGEYPLSEDVPLLYGNYNVQENGGISKNNASDIYTNYPVFPASSCKINNIRYWRRPTNGKCSRAEMCGNLYSDTETYIPPEPPLLGWGETPRVNYYKTHN